MPSSTRASPRVASSDDLAAAVVNAPDAAEAREHVLKLLNTVAQASDQAFRIMESLDNSGSSGRQQQRPFALPGAHRPQHHGPEVAPADVGASPAPCQSEQESHESPGHDR